MELQEIQKEVALVKKALRENVSYLGMQGETLQRYFLQLNEKENIFLSKQLKTMTGNLLGASSGSNGTISAGYPTAEKLALVAREMPAGEPVSFNTESLPAICAHMITYEASAKESAKALRALSSQAYNNAAQVGANPDAMPQVIRLLQLHPAENHVQLNGMRALCNMAYESSLALEKLSSKEVIGVIVNSIIQKPESKEICGKAQETVARIVSAEVGPENGPPPSVPPERSPLRALFTVLAPDAGQAPKDVIVQLVEQLLANEVATPEFLARKFVDAAPPAKEDSMAATAWLMLAKVLAMKEIKDFSDALVKGSAIPAAHSLMQAQVSCGPAQLAGIEAMSGLVGNRWPGLQAFAEVRGIERIVDAMSSHPDEVVLQTKGIRAMASGVNWPDDIQKKAGYEYKRGVELTKSAMAKHVDNEELVIAGLEALTKYLDRMKCINEVKSDGGDGLIKAIITKYSDSNKVKGLGTLILETLGEKGWTPKGNGKSS
jgi:hypothetical protein